MITIHEALAALAVSQEMAEGPVAGTAPAWLEYSVYGAIALLILTFVVRGMRSRPAPGVEDRAPPEADRGEPAGTPEPAASAAGRVHERDTGEGGDARPAVEKPGPSAVDPVTPPVHLGKSAAGATAPSGDPGRKPGKPGPAQRGPTDRAPSDDARPAPPPPQPATKKTAPAPTPAPPTRPEPLTRPAPKIEKKPPPADLVAPAPQRAPPADLVAPAPQRAPAAERDAPVVAPVEAAGRTLREGLARTHDGFVRKLGRLFGGARTLDDDLLAELEEALFTADIGVRTSQRLVSMVQESMGRKELNDPGRVWARLKEEISRVLEVDAAPVDFERARPFVIMVVGVNGAGKTTSIGKLARQLTLEGKKVILAAGDTFRAAAVEQLEVWAQRAGVPVVRGAESQDPASVIYEACERAEREGLDVVIADTAGRLQARKELMDELGKIHRVIGKAIPGAPHEVWLVLDATNGQNAISQAKEFTQVVSVSGIVLTKLDGTAKGGVVIGICDEMRLPVRYIGIGEKVEDLRRFNPADFATALFEEGSG